MATKTISIKKPTLTNQTSCFKEEPKQLSKLPPSGKDLLYPGNNFPLARIKPEDRLDDLFVPVCQYGPVSKQISERAGTFAAKIALEESRPEDAPWAYWVSYSRRAFLDNPDAFSEKLASQSRGKSNRILIAKIDQSLKSLSQDQTQGDFGACAAWDAAKLNLLGYSGLVRVAQTGHQHPLHSGFPEGQTLVPGLQGIPRDLDRYCLGPHPGTLEPEDLAKQMLEWKNPSGHGSVVLGLIACLEQSEDYKTVSGRKMGRTRASVTRSILFGLAEESGLVLNYFGYEVPGEYVDGLSPEHRYFPDLEEDQGETKEQGLLELLKARNRETLIGKDNKKEDLEGRDLFAMPGFTSSTGGMGLPLEAFMGAFWLDLANWYLSSLPVSSGGGKGLTLSEIPWFRSLKLRAYREYADARIPLLPKNPRDVLEALAWTPNPKTVKVVLLAQDPFPNHEDACGAAFSVPPGRKGKENLPPSLSIIIDTILMKVKPKEPVSPETEAYEGCLYRWAKQGVLLLNTCMNVVDSHLDPHLNNLPRTRKDMGWENLVILLLNALGKAREDVCFLGFGEEAKALLGKCPELKRKKGQAKRVWYAPHPSPLGNNLVQFQENAGFEEANQFLRAQKRKPILW